MIYSNCYHAHTPFIDMTSITVLERLMSAQTANSVLPTMISSKLDRSLQLADEGETLPGKQALCLV